MSECIVSANCPWNETGNACDVNGTTFALHCESIAGSESPDVLILQPTFVNDEYEALVTPAEVAIPDDGTAAARNARLACGENLTRKNNIITMVEQDHAAVAALAAALRERISSCPGPDQVGGCPSLSAAAVQAAMNQHIGIDNFPQI